MTPCLDVQLLFINCFSVHLNQICELPASL